MVAAGTYTENIVVDKSLTIKSIAGAATTFVTLSAQVYTPLR
jgi:hypothetical protein